MTRMIEIKALTTEQDARLWAGGNIAGLPLTCDYCDQPAVWSTSAGKGRVTTACFDLRHIAFAESIGSGVPPESLVDALYQALRDEEIADILSKPKRWFAQFDGWINVEPGDCVMVPDEHGDVCTGGLVHDRQRSSTAVRILVDPNADHAAVARVLERLADWVRSGERFDPSSPEYQPF